MSEAESRAEQPMASERSTDSGSVFGNLPKQRPGSRSPRRNATEDRGAKASAGEPKKPAGREPSKPAGRRPPVAKPAQAPPPPPPPGQGPPPPAQSGGIEDLAWAGVTVAAQAATVGVKLASRAIEAVRKSVEGK